MHPKRPSPGRKTCTGRNRGTRWFRNNATRALVTSGCWIVSPWKIEKKLQHQRGTTMSLWREGGKLWKSCWWNERKHEMKATNLYAVFRRIAISMGVNSDRPYGRSILADEELTWANSISSNLTILFENQQKLTFSFSGGSTKSKGRI